VLDDGHYAQAVPLLEECYMIRKKFLYGEPITADTLYMLAEIHRKSGDLTLALETLKNTLELQVLLYGMLCEQSALCIHSTAEIKLIMGSFSEAFTLFNDNLARRIETVGNVGAALAGVSRVKLAQGKVKEALDFAEQSYKLRIKQHKGLKNVEVVDSLFCKSRVELVRGDNDTAKILAEQGLANLRFCTRDSSPAVALALMQVGETLHPAGRYTEALEKFDQAMAMVVSFLGECNHMVPTIQIHRAKTLLTIGNFKDALLAIEDASRIISALGKRKDAGNLLPADLAHVYGHYYKYIGNFSKASESYKDALTKYNTILQDTLPTEHKSHPTVAVILLDLADIERARGK
jgi:tetratricopeptide (TPR) repeat protein